MNSSILTFLFPPVPHFIDCGTKTFPPGEGHLNRIGYGVFDLVVVTKGRLFIGEENNKWTLEKDEGLFLRPDLSHYSVKPCDEETQISWVHFHTFGAWREYNDVEECLKDQHRLRNEHKQITYLLQNHINMVMITKQIKLPKKALECLEHLVRLDQEPRSLSRWEQQSVFQQFLQYIDRELSIIHDMPVFRVVEKTQLYIHQNYQKPITNKTLYQELNFHPNYLARCMQKVYGMTPMEYLTVFRIEQAKKMLIKTEWSISQIAFEVGFNQISYFSVCFSRKEGISPLNYRKKYIKHL
jgi:AraC-like DNA-binding protein